MQSNIQLVGVVALAALGAVAAFVVLKKKSRKEDENPDDGEEIKCAKNSEEKKDSTTTSDTTIGKEVTQEICRPDVISDTKENSEPLEVVAPEGNSFEFLTQPASMEESYVDIVPQVEDVRGKIEIYGETDPTATKTYADIVSMNNGQDNPEEESVSGLGQSCKDESVILCDSPIDDSIVILEKTNCDDSVIISDKEIKSVRKADTGSTTRSPSPRENENRRITRGSLKNDTDDNKEEIQLLKTIDVTEKDLKILEESDFTDSDESESGESAESVETQITTDLEKSDAETVIKGNEQNPEESSAAEETSKDELNESLKIDLRPSWQAKK